MLKDTKGWKNRKGFMLNILFSEQDMRYYCRNKGRGVKTSVDQRRLGECVKEDCKGVSSLYSDQK